MKRFLRLVAIFVTLAVVMAFAPSCEEKFTEEKFFTFEYDEQTDTYTVGASAEVLPKTVIIPAEYEGKPVVGVKENGFSGENCYAVKDVVFKGNSVAVGKNAFKGLVNLRSIELRNALNVSFGEFAFENCSALEEIILLKTPEKLTFGAYSFSYTALTVVDVTATAVEVFECAFSNTPITKLTAKGVTAFTTTAVNGCGSIVAFDVTGDTFVSENGNLYVVNDGVKKLAKYAPASPATEFTIETAVLDGAFKNCVNLQKVTVSASVNDLPAYVFYETSVSEINVYENYVNFNEKWISGCNAEVKIIGEN